MLGSSRKLPRSPKDPRISDSLGGILSADPRENPGFADWSLAVLNYCDGGGFAGTAGRKLVAGVPEGWYPQAPRRDSTDSSGGSQDTSSGGAFFPGSVSNNGGGGGSGGGGGGGGGEGGGGGGSGSGRKGFFGHQRAGDNNSDTAHPIHNGSISRGSSVEGMSSRGRSLEASGGRSGAASVGGYGSGTVTKELYLDGYKIVSAFMEDLVRSRGTGGATHVLVSGCSAGAQAVMAVCDRFKLLLPRASVKCLMDGGMFVDARGRRGRRPMRSQVRKVVGLHSMRLNSNCVADFQPSKRWRCFFPQHALSRMAAPVFLVNSLFDQIALSMGGQLDSLNRTHTSSCIWAILRARRDIQHMVLSKGLFRRQFWSRGAPQWCGVREEGAVVSAAFDTFKYTVARPPQPSRALLNRCAPSLDRRAPSLDRRVRPP
ncbi:unnamed protein product [Closterium sp. NIES-65]|nr:unnamed protein product [Closterium sp. NIES-65]